MSVAISHKNTQNGDRVMDEALEMSTKELERYDVLNGVRRKALTQGKAVELLGISDRQVRNLPTLIERSPQQQQKA